MQEECRKGMMPTGSVCAEYRAQRIIFEPLEVVYGSLKATADLSMGYAGCAGSRAHLDGRGTPLIAYLFDVVGG